jgi:S1-C subfamily serine protease
MRRLVSVRPIWLIVFASGLLCGIALIMFALVLPYERSLLAQAIPSAAPTPTLPPDSVFAQLDARDEILTNLYKRVSPSVVHITSHSQSLDVFSGVVPSEGTGSGFVFDAGGHIVTNNHVVAGADSLEVLLPTGVSLPATVVGTDSYYDVAVVHIEVPADALAPLDLGDSSKLQVGQTVIAIGNPFGLDRTLTSGLISALGRVVQTDSGGEIGQAIQTDAAINPGNSGGPLLDTRGRVVGMNTAINSPSGGSVGIGFAVPVNIVKLVATTLIAKGHYSHPSLGVTTVELGTEVNPPQNGPAQGLLIVQVAGGGPAEKAGLQATTITRQRLRQVYSGGDIITAVDGKAVATKNDLQLYLEENHQPGDTVTVTISRDGQSQDVKVTLGEQ